MGCPVVPETGLGTPLLHQPSRGQAALFTLSSTPSPSSQTSPLLQAKGHSLLLGEGTTSTYRWQAPPFYLSHPGLGTEARVSPHTAPATPSSLVFTWSPHPGQNGPSLNSSSPKQAALVVWVLGTYLTFPW